MSDSFERTLKLILLAVAIVFVLLYLARVLRNVVRRRGYMEFMYCLNHGDLEQAEDLFQRLVAWNPRNLGAWPIFRMALIDLRLLTTTVPLPYERIREFFESLANSAITNAPKSPYPYLLAAGLASQRTPGSEQCRNYLSQALALANRNLEIYMWAGEIQLIAGYYRDSARYFNTVQRIAKLNHDERIFCSSVVALAQLYSSIEAAHNREESPSIVHWKKSLSLESDNLERISHSLMQANEFARCGQNATAIEVMYKAFTDCPADARTPAMVILLRPCVTALLRQNEPDLAERLVQRAKELSVHGWTIEAARVAWHRGDKERTKELLNQARNEDDGTSIYSLRLALLCGDMGNEAQQLAMFEQAAKKADQITSNKSSSANNINDVTINTLVFFPFEPNLLGIRSVASELATAYQQRAMYDEAVAVWTRALRHDEHNPVKMVRLAQALNQSGKREEAMKYARQAESRLLTLVEEAPDCPLLHLALGHVYSLDGDSVQAALHYSLVTCEPHLKEALRAVSALDTDQDSLIEKMQSWLETQDDTESRRRLATFLALHSPAEEAKSDT